jgi:DNA-binding MarR family transcriptional regulator
MPKSHKPTNQAPIAPRAASRIEQACRRAVLGKLAVRDIARWVSAFGVSEIEFRLLWLLFTTAESPAANGDADLDQGALATQLAVSPAQVSAVVDRLRAAGRVVSVVPADDRRRQLWLLTPAGRELVLNVAAAVDALPPAGPAGKEAA